MCIHSFANTLVQSLRVCQGCTESHKIVGTVASVAEKGWFADVASCYDQFSLLVGTENKGDSEVGEILTTAYREFGGCAHHCAGKPKRREQDQASLRRRGHVQSGTAEEQLPKSDDFCWVRARRWTPSCVCYMSWTLSKVGGCRRRH